MAGQSTVNFFDINNKRKNQNQGTTGMFSGSSTTGGPGNTPTYANKYTKEMEKLDSELENEGLKIERLSDQDKWNYVNSLTDAEYERLNQYKDAGYSFGSAKALLDLERQRNDPNNVGGYRGVGYQLSEPIGGKDSRLNRINLPGRITEYLDDRVQNDVVPALTVSRREKKSQELYDKYSKMTQEDRDKLYEQFKNDPKARTFEDDSLEYTLKRYREDQNKSFWDRMWGAGLKISEDENGVQVSPDTIASPLQAASNIPISALANATAVARGATNRADNLYMLVNLLGTKEGRDILTYRYLDEQGSMESAEQDPIGWVLDLYDFGALGLNRTSKVSRLGGKGSRLVGAKNTANRLNSTADKLAKASNSLENIADMGISEAYSKLLDKQLDRLSKGNKGANLLGDYISLTQRPLATIWNGAGPSQNYINEQKKNSQQQTQEQQKTPADDRDDYTWTEEYEQSTNQKLPDSLDKGVKWIDKDGVEHKGTRKQMIESLAIEDDSVKGLPIGSEATAQGYDPDTSWRISYGGEMTTDSRGEPTRLNGRRVMISAEEGRYFDWLKKNKQQTQTTPSQTYTYTPGSWTIGGLQKPFNKIMDSVKEKIQTSATGLTPEVRERIKQNPFIRDYRERIEAMINDEGAPMDNQKIMEMPIEEVGNELLRRLNEYEAKLEENGKEYQVLRSTTKPYDFSNFMYGVYEVFADNGISITPEGELTFSTTANPADMNPVNTARYVIRDMESNLSNMTISQFLDFRKKLRSLINYESDSRSTRYSKNIIRQLVDGKLNQLAHEMIPSLAKVDEIYSKEKQELKEFKDGLVYQQGEKRGQIKDNFYSIISTLNTQNRQKMKERVERLYPELGARVEAIRMLPNLAKAYQKSPQMMRALFQKAGFIGGIAQSGGVKQAVIGWLLGIVADELFAKPLGEKWRKKAIDELLNEVSPEALQKLAEIKSKVDAGVELSEQEKRDLATAMTEIAIREYEYLDEQHKKELDKILESANNQQPKLPAPGVDTISPDGTIKLGMGNQLNSPETYKPKTREQRVKEIQEEYGVEPGRAEEMANTVEDFLDEIGGDINGEINPREVNYEKFSTKTLNELMNDDLIPQSEKDKIGEILSKRDMNEAVRSEDEADHDFAYRINKLQEEELRIGKVGKNKVNKTVADQQMRAWEKKKEKVIKEMEEYYGIDQFQAQDKYLELESKGDDYINEYKNSKRFQEDQAELQVLNQLKEQWKSQKKFIRDMDGETAQKRDQIVNQELRNGYRWETTDYGDRFINANGDRGIVKYGPEGKISVVLTPIGFAESGITDILPPDTEVRFEGDADSIPLGEIRQSTYTDDEIPQFQTVGRANPNQRTVSAEEGLGMKDFRNGRTVQELADDYGLKVEIIDKIFTESGAKALGRYKNKLIELAKSIKEGTAPHEIFHGVFDMVNQKRKNEILQLVQERKGMSEAEAKEWLAESFGDYFLTGKFDTKPIPKGFINKVKWFFGKVKEFINGTYRDRKKIQKLFDDILDNKIERDVQADMLGEFFQTEKGGSPLNSRKERSSGNPPKNRVNITDENASQYKSKLLDLKKRADDMDSQEFIDELRGIFVSPEGSNYLLRNKDGEPYTLRISDHRGNANNYKNYKQYKNNISVSVEIIKRRFRSNDKVDLIDLKYEGKTLTNEQKQGMIDGVIDWIDKQEYTDTHYNDKKVSPKSKAEYQYQIEQKSLFEEDEVNNEENHREFDEEYKTLHNILEWATRGTGIAPERLPLSLNDTYTPDLKEWVRRMNEDDLDDRKGKFNEESLIDLYFAYQKVAENPKAMQFIRSNKDEFHMKPYYELLTKITANPLQIPEQHMNEKWLGPLRRALYASNDISLNTLMVAYDPDIVEWASNLKGKLGSKVTMKELSEIRDLLDDYINNANLDIPVKGTFNDEGINNLILTRKGRPRDKELQKISTYDQNQINKVAKETDDILDRRLKQIKMQYEYRNPNVQGLDEAEKQRRIERNEMLEDDWLDFEAQFLYGLAKSYDPNVDKWHKNLKKRFSENLKNFEGFKGVNRYENLVEPHQLNSLKAKIEELSKYSHDQIFKMREGTSTDVFFRYLEPKIKELEAKGKDKVVRDLIALSDMSVENFTRQIKAFGGKSPMPSIAVQDPNVPSGAFGDLTVLFGRDTVDPEVDERNKLYGSDAWTPMFPWLENREGTIWNYRPSLEEIEQLAESPLSHTNLTEDQKDDIIAGMGVQLNRLGVETDLKKFQADYNLSEIYEYAEGIVEEAVEGNGLDREENREAYLNLAKDLANLIAKRGTTDTIYPEWRGEPEMNKIKENLSIMPEEDRQKFMVSLEIYLGNTLVNPDALYPDAIKIVNNAEKRSGKDFSNYGDGGDWTDYYRNVIDLVERILQKASVRTQIVPGRYFDETPTYRNADQIAEELVDYVPDEVKENYDEGTSGLNRLQSDILKELNKHTSLMDRIANLLDALETHFGIDYSQKVEEIVRRLELQEPGDRIATPENILEAMKGQEVRRQTDLGSFRDMIQIEGTEVHSIEDVRKRNFAKVYHGDRVGELGDLEKRYDDLLNIIYDYAKEFGWYEKGMTASELEEGIKRGIADAYDPDINKFREELKEGDVFRDNVPDEVLQRLIDVVEQGRKIPIRFSESKPERVVDLFKEVKYVLVPNLKKESVERAVKGTPLEGKVVGYKDSGDIPYRVKKIKELQKKYGDIFFSMGGTIMPIAMLYMMMQGGEDDEGEGQEA